MCRLFGVLGNASTPADTWLLATDRSLLAQAHEVPAQRQPDGWGIAWYTAGGVPRVEKGVAGAFEDRARFESVARTARGPLVLGHLRKASNPMRLAHHRLLGLENTQPFSSDRTLFAHNGSILHPKETRAVVGGREAQIRGVNDSEVLFYLLLAQLDAGQPPVVAYTRAVSELDAVWAKLGRPPGGAFSGLNILLSRGPEELYAFCHWRGEHGSSFFDPARPYYQMAFVADAKQVVVGSEPFDSRGRGWSDLHNGEYLAARSDRGLVTVETGRLPLAAGT